MYVPTTIHFNFTVNKYFIFFPTHSSIKLTKKKKNPSCKINPHENSRANSFYSTEIIPDTERYFITRTHTHNYKFH